MKYLSWRKMQASYRQIHIKTSCTRAVHGITSAYNWTRLCYFKHFSLACNINAASVYHLSPVAFHDHVPHQATTQAAQRWNV